MNKAKKIVLALFEKKMYALSITETVNVGLEIVEQWLPGGRTVKV